MRGSLLLRKNEKGMFFPFVLFIALILFSVITTLIAIYNNELKISNQLWEQMKAESIVQMSSQQFINERIYEEEENGTVFFTFPQGEAIVTYLMEKENQYYLTIEIITDRNVNFIMNTRVTP